MKGTMTMSRSSELSLALASYQWDPAVALVKSKPALARTFSVRLGFFEGRQASTCLPLHEASTGVAPVNVAKAILDAYPDAAQWYVILILTQKVSFALKIRGHGLTNSINSHFFSAAPSRPTSAFRCTRRAAGMPILSSSSSSWIRIRGVHWFLTIWVASHCTTP